MEFCWVPRPRARGGGRCRLGRGAFPPGTCRPSLSSSGPPQAQRRERRGGRGVGWRGWAGAPWALLQPCSSLRRLGGSMWRRPAWQVGPCGAGPGRSGCGRGGTRPGRPRGGEGAAGERQLQPLCPAAGLAETLRPRNSARPLPWPGEGRTGRPGALAWPCPLVRASALGLPLGRESRSFLTGLEIPVTGNEPNFQFLRVDL